MQTFNVGQIFKSEKPFPNEDTEQSCIVKEDKVGNDDIRIDITPLNLGLAFPLFYTVRSTELID